MNIFSHTTYLSPRFSTIFSHCSCSQDFLVAPLSLVPNTKRRMFRSEATFESSFPRQSSWSLVVSWCSGEQLQAVCQSCRATWGFGRGLHDIISDLKVRCHVDRLGSSPGRIARRKRRERYAVPSASDGSNSRLSVIEAELQSGQSPMELAEFPLGGPEAGGFEWSGSAIGRVDGDDDVTALIVPRMPHHVAPRRSPFLPRFALSPSDLSILLFLPSCSSLHWPGWKTAYRTRREERDFFLLIPSLATFSSSQQNVPPIAGRSLQSRVNQDQNVVVLTSASWNNAESRWKGLTWKLRKLVDIRTRILFPLCLIYSKSSRMHWRDQREICK